MSSGDHLATLIGAARTVLLDFDGPLCDLFAVVRAHDVAADLHTLNVAVSLTMTADPLEVLREAYFHSADLGRDIEARVVEYETKAALTATPTMGGHEFARRMRESGRKVAVVSNNSLGAIETYLERHQMTDVIDDIAARPFGAPERMKPSTVLVDEALIRTGTAPRDALFVGDSTTDIVAGRRAAVPCVGFAKGDPGRAEELTRFDPTAVVFSMSELLRSVGGSGQ